MDTKFKSRIDTRIYLRRAAFVVAVVALLASQVMASGSDDAPRMEAKLSTGLTGATFAGIVPHAKAEFEMENAVRRFEVEVQQLNVPNLSLVDVLVNGVKIGSIRIFNRGGVLLLSSFAGQAVPSIAGGTVVTIRYGSLTVLSGKF